MRNLLRCRRGSAAFATVVALVPLIGVVALGAEAGSWYVTKQHAQNAADAAAYSGGLRLACSISGSSNCDKAQDYIYRGKQFADQNMFCDPRGSSLYPCASSPPTGTTQTVQIDQPTSSSVRAIVSQQQPTYLAAVLGLSTVNIGATAIAEVQTLAKPCVLALTGSISFQGSPNINAPNCGMASNDPAKDAINFTGGGMSINVDSLSAAGGCTGTASFCNKALTYMPPVTNPFSALDTAMASLPTLPNCPPGELDAYSVKLCKNDNVTLTGNTIKNLTVPGGVYFISGTLQLKGNSGITGTGTFILLPGASLSMKGTGSINITANATVTAADLPPALQTSAGLFSNMAIYDYQTTPDAIKIGGNSQITFIGNMYLPNTAVTFQGNPTVNANACGNQLIASSIAFNGNPTLNFDFNNNTCPSAIKPNSQLVRLVQ